MKRFTLDFDTDFKVIHSTEKSQAAIMVLKPGESTGGSDNKHKSDQWMFIMQGTGTAVINNEEADLMPGLLLLIEAGETHKISNNSIKNLETLNFYSGPEF